MFYDLEDPVAFADIERCLSHDGVWHLEQSYMPLMLKTTSMILFVMSIWNIILLLCLNVY